MRNVKFKKMELNTLKNYDWIKCFTFFTILFSLLFCLISFYNTSLYENLFLSYIEILTFAVMGYYLLHGDYFRDRCYYIYLIFPCWIIISHWLKTEFVLLQSDQVTFVLRCLICGIALPFARLMKDTVKRKYLNFFAFIIILTIAIILCLCYWGFLRGENITLLNGCLEFGVIYNRTGRVMLNAINLHYYHLGYLSVVCFFMTLYLTISYWSYKVAPFGIFLLLLFASGVILTYSRTGVIALLIGIFLAIAIFSIHTSQ